MSEPTGMSQQAEGSPAEALSGRLEELNRQIVSSMESAVRGFHHDLSGLANEAGSVGSKKTAGSLLDAFARIDREDSQSSILVALLEEGQRFASRTAFFLMQPEHVVVWGSRGFGESDNTLQGRSIDSGGLWNELADCGGSLALTSDGCEQICRQLDTEASSQGILIPFVVRGQLGGAIYSDLVGDSGQLLSEGLQLLTHNASQAVELIAFGNRGSSPALRQGQDEEASHLPIWQPNARADEAADEDAGTEHPGDASEAFDNAEDAAPELLTSIPATPDPEVAESPPEDAAEPEPFVAEPSSEVGFESDDEQQAEDTAFEEPTLDDATPASTFAQPEPLIEPTFAEPIAEPAFAEPELTPEPSPSEFATSPSAFGAPEPGTDDLSDEAIPEPELEDTSTDIWSLEEEEEDDEPTLVGQIAEPVAESEVAEPEVMASESVDSIPVIDANAALPVESMGQATVRLDIAALQGQASTFATGPDETPEPAAPVAIPEPVVPPPVETSFSQPETAYVPPPAVETPAPSFTDPVTSGGFVPPPPEPKAESASASNEVRPPEDHQGPGLAFTSSADSDEALHEEARRLARLLVSEIKLYNEEIIEEGKRNGDIYDRLKDDIDRSRQMYQERIDPKIQGKEDYFYQELVQRLAGGDAGVLGMS